MYIDYFWTFAAVSLRFAGLVASSVLVCWSTQIGKIAIQQVVDVAKLQRRPSAKHICDCY
jgi:hypothetical protein